MSLLFELKTITKAKKESAIRSLVVDSIATRTFYIALVLSTIIITFGLILSDPIVIIAGCLVTPTLYPILSLGLGFSVSDVLLMKRSSKTILSLFLYVLITSIVVVLFFGSLGNLQSAEIIIRSTPSLLYLFIAIITTAAMCIFLVRDRKESVVLASTAMSISLIVPIAVIGIAIAQVNFQLVQGAFLLFLINMVGSIFSGVILFSLFDFSEKKILVRSTMDTEYKNIEKENQRLHKEYDNEYGSVKARKEVTRKRATKVVESEDTKESVEEKLEDKKEEPEENKEEN